MKKQTKTPTTHPTIEVHTTCFLMFLALGGEGMTLPVASVAYQVIFEPGIGQFRDFEPSRVHTRIYLLGLFLVHKLNCGKRESVS